MSRDDTARAYLDRLNTKINDGQYPSLALAQPRIPDGAICRLVGSGWTLERLERLMASALNRVEDAAEKPREAGWMTEAVYAVAHLSPDEVEAWAAVWDNSLWRFGEPRIVGEIDAWRAAVPGQLAPLCDAAGLDIAEAADMLAAGSLNEDALRMLAGLRAPTRLALELAPLRYKPGPKSTRRSP